MQKDRRSDSWSISKEPKTPLLIAAKPVQQVTAYKLLDVIVNLTFKWDDHVNDVTSKAAKLKRASVNRLDLLYFYTAVIWPIVEYEYRLHRLKTSNASLLRSLPATFDMKKHVVCSTYLYWLTDVIA